MSFPSLLYADLIKKQKLVFDPVQETVLTKLDIFCKEYRQSVTSSPWFWQKPSRPAGIYLWGDVGRGKTFLLELLVRALSPLPVRRLSLHSWILELQQTNLSEDVLPRWAKDFVRETPLLFLDEMEISHIADGMLLQRALESLWNAGLILLTTSNLSPAELYPGGLQRELLFPLFKSFASRLQVIPLNAPTDYRQRHLNRGDLYYTPLDDETEEGLRFLWKFLAGDVPFQPRKLSFSGRFLELPRASSLVCWMTFEEACRHPLGLLDYQQIVATFPYLIISDIPKLTRQDEDAVRRLILLIDLLYAKGHVTIFSAAVEPEKLYTGTQQAFSRTVSRLQEMRFWPLPLNALPMS